MFFMNLRLQIFIHPTTFLFTPLLLEYEWVNSPILHKDNTHVIYLLEMPRNDMYQLCTIYSFSRYLHMIFYVKRCPEHKDTCFQGGYTHLYSSS